MGGEAGTGEQQLALPAGEEVAIRFLELHLLLLLCFSSCFCDPFLCHFIAQRLQVLSYSNQRISTSQLLGFGLQCTQGFFPEEESGLAFHTVLCDWPAFLLHVVSPHPLDPDAMTIPRHCLQAASGFKLFV